MLGIFAGLRCVEIATLKVEDIDWANNTFRVTGKGDKERALPIHPEIAAALKALPVPAWGPVFEQCLSIGGWPGPTHPASGGVLRPLNVSGVVRRHLRKVGIEASAHQLRHTFATEIFRATQDVLLTQQLLGHASPVMTARYAAADQATATPAVMSLRIPSLSDHDERKVAP